jgi:hypothetical protein
VKFEHKTEMIKELKPLENPKKDFSHLMEDLINKEEVNNMILNNIKKKSIAKLGIENPTNERPASNIKSEVIVLNNKTQRATSFLSGDNPRNGIKLTKANDFGTEKREGKTQLLESDLTSQSQSSRSNIAKKTQYKKTGSILDYIKKSSKSFESAQDNNDDVMFAEGLERIEEISEDLFKEKKNETNNNLKGPNRKRKNFMIDDGKDKIKYNKKFAK